MKKLVVYIAALITSAVIGVTYVPAAEKIFMPDSYYIGLTSDGEPDYQSAYYSYNSFGVEAKSECEKAAVNLPADKYIYEPTNKYNFKWFWALPDKRAHPEYLQPYVKGENNYGYTYEDGLYVWKLDDSTKYLISIANATLEASSANPDDAYPSEGKTDGVHMVIIITIPEDEVSYRVTYGSMERWWCCINKKERDAGSADRPLYAHTVDFKDSDRFYSGSVIGIAGVTGHSQPATGARYLFARIEKCATKEGVLLGDWVTVKLKDLYME